MTSGWKMENKCKNNMDLENIRKHDNEEMKETLMKI